MMTTFLFVGTGVYLSIGAILAALLIFKGDHSEYNEMGGTKAGLPLMFIAIMFCWIFAINFNISRDK
ncbi:hypothetical protein [Bacillus cereus]|uniref:hypothetical protein n=1 Tax=Bacillus cereus TaxID=1396 RepID=UPI0011A9247F|nr:hypothetical protein [Bacillus cereus]